MTEIDKNIEQNQSNNYEQNGSSGIGHLSGGEIKDGARVAGVYNQIQANTVNFFQKSHGSAKKEAAQKAPQLQLEKFALARDKNNYLTKQSDGLLLAEQIYDSTFPKFDVGVSNLGDNSIYITGIRIEVINFYSLQLQPIKSEKVIKKITIVLKKCANEADFQALIEEHNLKLKRKYEQICILAPLGTFIEEDLTRLRHSPIVENVEVTAIGEGYAVIEPSAVIEAVAMQYFNNLHKYNHGYIDISRWI